MLINKINHIAICLFLLSCGPDHNQNVNIAPPDTTPNVTNPDEICLYGQIMQCEYLVINNGVAIVQKGTKKCQNGYWSTCSYLR